MILSSARARPRAAAAAQNRKGFRMALLVFLSLVLLSLGETDIKFEFKGKFCTAVKERKEAFFWDSRHFSAMRIWGHYPYQRHDLHQADA
jgi:hypothetical protein